MDVSQGVVQRELMDHRIRVLIMQMAKQGYGIDDVIADLKSMGIAVSRDDVKRIVLNAGGRTGATIGRGGGPNKEAER